MVQKAICDWPGTDLSQAHGVSMQGCGFAGYIEYANDVPPRRKNWSSMATEYFVAFKKVLAAMYPDGGRIEQGSADGISAAQGLGPTNAGLKRHLFRFMQEIDTACLLKNDTGGIGQQYHALGASHQRSERFDFRFSELQNIDRKSK